MRRIELSRTFAGRGLDADAREEPAVVAEDRHPRPEVGRAAIELVVRADLAARDIFLILENDCGVALGSADLSISAIAARAPVARALEIKRDVPVLRVQRLTHDSDGRPIDFEYLYLKGDAVQYQLRVERKRPGKARRRA